MPKTPSDWFSQRGRVAIVTGASRGLGLEIAEALASAGADLVLNAMDETRLKDVAERLWHEFEIKTTTVAGDVSSPETADRLVQKAMSDFGRLDVIVNNAGINVRGAIEEVTPDDFDRVMAVNVKGPWLVCRAAAKIFKTQRSGRVINLASTLGLVARADRSLYCASKGAVVQLTKELAVEWAQHGITVNALCPGPFKTEMNRVLFDDPEASRVFAEYTAMKRWGERGELGPAVLFLASDAASYVTGVALPVDGGWVVKS